MDQIVLEIIRHAGSPGEYAIPEKDCMRIGRGFDNDVILNDLFIDARHICLRKTTEGWECEDLGGLNGTFLLRQGASEELVRIRGTVSVLSGDILRLGKTSIRVWDRENPVRPALVFPEVSPSSFLAAPHQTIPKLCWSLLVFYSVYYFAFYHESVKQDVPVLMLVAQETALLVCLVVWSGLWALITRFSKRQHCMAQHLAFTCQWFVLDVVWSVLLKYTGFFVCNKTFNMMLWGGILALWGGVILNIHMAIATNLSARKRAVIAGGVMTSVLFLGGLCYYGFRDTFDPSPKHFINLVPLPERMIPTISAAEGIRRLDSIFEK